VKEESNCIVTGEPPTKDVSDEEEIPKFGQDVPTEEESKEVER